MAANILNKILNSEISIDETFEWLTTDNPYGIILPDVEQTDSLRVEFIFYFLDYLRKQCQSVLCPATTDGLEGQHQKLCGIPSTTSGRISYYECNKSENVFAHQLINTETYIRNPVAVKPTIKNTSLNSRNITSPSTQSVIHSPPHGQMNPHTFQYESPESHSSPFKIIPQDQIDDSNTSNLSMTPVIPCSPISPLYTSQMAATKQKIYNNKSRKSFNTTNSPIQNSNSGQKNKKFESHRSICLGDFITTEKSNSKSRNRNNSAIQSTKQSPGEFNQSIDDECSKRTPQKNTRLRRRIKPTMIVVNTSAENQQSETFGVVSRPPTTNPTFLEAQSTVETNDAMSFNGERELLKLQRQKQPIIVPVTDTALQDSSKHLIKPKHTKAVIPKLELVDNTNALDILAQLHGGILIKNLVPNPMIELYFIISLITSQQKVDGNIPKMQIQSESFEKSWSKVESLEQLKETMGCADLILDNSEENIGGDMEQSVEIVANSPAHKSNKKNNTELTADQLKYFDTVHNCVYFATKVLWNIKNLLSVFDRPTLSLICENALVKSFHLPLQQFLNELYEQKCLQSKNIKPYSYSGTLQSNVCFQVDTDNRDNFPSCLAFYTFRKQRDLFYEILKIWEDSHLQQNWSFQKMLGSKINTMVSMHSDAVNYCHIARLFKSQLLVSSIKIGQAEDAFCDTSLGVLKSLKDLNPEKLQQLQQRLVTPVSSMGPVPPPSFPGVQEFYRDFLLTSSDPKFNTILKDCFIQEIMELNDTQFTCSDIDAKEPKVNESTKHNYLLCISSLKLMAKFLGFLISLPYHSRNVTLQSETTQIALRSRIMPPLDLRECLYQALANKKLSLTVPWMVQYLAMLDSVSFRLPYYLNICKSLYCIYRDIQYSHHDETALLLAFSIGWFFELSNFPKDIYLHWITSFKNQKEELANEVSVYTSKKTLSIADDSNGNIDRHHIAFDELHIIDDRALYICCPYLKELKILLTSGNSNLNSNNANRHITPVSSKLPQASSAARTISLELQLQEAFFHGHPRSVRKTVDFIVERIASSCVKFICRTVIPSVKQKNLRIMKERSDDSTSNNGSEMHDRIASITKQIRDRCYEVIPEMCENKTRTSMESLLADDVLPAVKDMCVKIAVKMEIEQINQWLDSYINNAMLNGIFSEFGLMRIDDESEDDDKASIGMKKIPETNPDVPCATSVINDVRNSLWELLENNGRWSTLNVETISANTHKIYKCLTDAKNIVPSAQKVLYQLSVDYAIHLIVFRSDLFTSEVEEKLIEVWKMYGKDDNDSGGKLFSGVLSSRNVRILMLSKDNNIWIRYGKLIQQLLKHDLVSMDDFSSNCVSLLTREWSPNILQSFAKCMTEAICDYKSGGKYVDKITLLLDWIIQTCDTMDEYD